MATSVIRRYWVDLDDMRVTASLGDRNPIQEIRLKARDSARIGFQFHRGGVPELLAASTGITVGIKERNDFGGSYLASVTSFTAATTTNTVGFADTDFYYGQLDLNTVAIDTALGTSETSIDGMFEVQLDISGSGMRVSTETITCTVLNDINQGGEGTPMSADPPYPSASEVFRWKPGVTSLTGGTSADLDSIATTSITPPYAIAINNQDSSDLWEIWILTTGTDAEDPGNGIVRPDDYDGSTNAKVWKRKQLFAAVNDESVAAAVSATNYTPSAAHVEGHLAGIDTKLGTLAAAAEIVSDTTPQLGGNLDTNAFNIDFDDNKGIRDDSGNEQLWFQKTASAVNYLEITNAATGNAPQLASTGSDSNVSLLLAAAGTGSIQIANNLDTNGQNIICDDSTGILDSNGNELLTFTKSASAVNYLNVQNAPTGSGIYLVASGSDSNIDLNFSPAGSGKIVSNGNLRSTGYAELAEIAAPGTPSSGYGRLYQGTDGILRYVNDGGVTVPVLGDEYGYIVPNHYDFRAEDGTPVDTVLTNGQRVWQFPDAADSSINGRIILPFDMAAGSTLKVKIYWTYTSSSGDVVLGCNNTAAFADGSDSSAEPSTYSGTYEVTDTGLGVNYLMVTSAITMQNTGQPGQAMTFEVWRNGDDASDTLATAIQILRIVIQYTKKIGGNSAW